MSQIKVVLRDSNGELIEVKASEASQRLATDISLLQILMHAQHEGVLTYGDIRFGKIKQSSVEKISPPGRLKALTGAHATYNTSPPKTRPVHGRKQEMKDLDNWFSGRKPCSVVHGIAGIGKSTVRRTFTALKVISPMLPIGVATTNKLPIFPIRQYLFLRLFALKSFKIVSFKIAHPQFL